MSRYKKRSAILVLIAVLFLAACSEDEQLVGEEVEKTEASDEELIAVIETNVNNLMEKNIEGYMNTIHPDSPVYETTEETISDLFEYDLQIELSEIEVSEKTGEEAVVSYTQQSIDEDEESDFENNETIGEHILRQDGNDWKIYQSEVLSVTPIESEDNEQEEVVEVEIEGDYAEAVTDLNTPFPEAEWYLISYGEGEGEARAEYIPVGENPGNYEEMIAYDYYENGNETSSLANFVSVLQLSLEEMVTGELDFIRLLETESEVIYRFSLQDDATEANQDEIGRIFIRENDIYVVSYTLIEDELDEEERDELIELLSEV